MPEDSSPGDVLSRVVSALNAIAPELDGTELAEALWLASQIATGAEAAPAVPQKGRFDETAKAQGPLAEESEAGPPDAGHSLHERLAGAQVRIRGDAVAPSRAPGLPRALHVTRALRPWKRPWPQGRRLVLDTDATVDGYARSGELVPVFTPAPERWFDLVLVVDHSPAMQVWRETIKDFTAVLDRLGAFRTLQVRELRIFEDGIELRDGQNRLTAPGRLRSPDGRRLVVVVSDCATPGWRKAPVWRQLREWAAATSVALLNPLPTKLWRRTALDLPTARVLPLEPGSPNSRLLFQPPLLPTEDDAVGDGGWIPIPVLSFSPHSLSRWSRTLMRMAPQGCGAALVPRGGRIERRSRQQPSAVTTERFLRTASPPAARLAVLCSAFDRLSTRMLHLIRQELVPEATAADVAELLTGGLFNLSPAQNGVVELSLPETVQQQLMQDLTERDLWRTHRVLSRHTASRDTWGERVAAVAANPHGAAEVPAAAQAFGQASQRTLELLGLSPRSPASPSRTEVAEWPARPAPARSPLKRAEGGSHDTGPYFYLSYAHTPAWGSNQGEPDHWVHVLFTDLCDHIMQLTDLPAGVSAGFMDRDMQAGDGWPEKLAEQLATCRVFVPLFSPRYFTSEMCGREWYAFNERILHARAAGAGSLPSIIPALWTRVDYDQLPESVRHIHVDHAAFGARYADEGLYSLIKLNRLRDEYQETVMQLARRIVQVAHDSPLPPSKPRRYEDTPSAFKPRGEGLRNIHLTVAAPTLSTIPKTGDPRRYTEDPLGWNPYPEESTRDLVGLAAELIRSLDYRVTVSSLFDATPDTADGAEPGTDTVPSACPSILLVDPWALLDDDYQHTLREFDANTDPWVSVIVPWNRNDVRFQGKVGEALHEALERTLPLLLERSGSRTAVGVPTMTAFTNVLAEVVGHTARRFLSHSTPRRPPASTLDGRQE
ncbi:TIR-like protein FxsC [Streptomyces lannensis]|uniref:TIR domain-containing protein n=1 Tax=Streptomyces lannensis TaxID=766498 RepID=A0ABP7KRK5_9ACTN